MIMSLEQVVVITIVRSQQSPNMAVEAPPCTK